jgi:hypothetical protein
MLVLPNGFVGLLARVERAFNLAIKRAPGSS